MTAEPDPQFTFENTTPDSRDWTETDGGAVAREFLNLKTPEQALLFFQKYGPLEKPEMVRERNRCGPVGPFSMIRRMQLPWPQIKDIQSAFASALEDKPIEPQDLKEFVFQPLPVVLTHHEGTFHKDQSKENRAFAGKSYFDTSGVAACGDVVSALRAITFLSRGVVWRLCANPKCDYGLFKPARPNQMYHDAACTHRAMANRFNKKTRDGINKRTRKGKKGRKK
jgi:hypothetical protein